MFKVGESSRSKGRYIKRRMSKKFNVPTPKSHKGMPCTGDIERQMEEIVGTK